MFFGTIVNAAQGVAGQVSGQLGAFAGTMLKALNPVIAKSEGAGNRQLMLKASMMGSKMSLFLLMFLFIPILIEMPYIFKLWLKNVPDYAVIFCRLYLIQNLISESYVTLSSTIAAVGNIRKYQITISFLNILPIIFTFGAFKLGYSPYYMYIIFIFFSLITGTVSVYFTKINCGLSIRYYFKEVILRSLFTFIPVLILGMIPIYFLGDGFIRLIVVLCTTSVLFLFVVITYGLSKDERKTVLLVMRPIINNLKIRIIVVR
jgi:hypothetical protein